MRLFAGALAAVTALVSAPAATGLPVRDGHGLKILAVKNVDRRLVDVTFETTALPSPVSAYILLPADYWSHPRRRFPVLYLLHGTSGQASDWTVKGDAEKVIGDRELITVMPDIALNDGGGGWCTNWPDGAQSWETFHIDQLIPWVDANVRTVPTRAERAIAGLSQGGFCSLSYAARHPDLFGTALGYSGAPDIYYDADARAGAKAIINAIEVGLDGVPPDTFFGSSATDAINWAAHDPATLAENLRLTRLYMYWGNGDQGPYDSAPIGSSTTIEQFVWGDNNDFEARLQSLGVPAYFDDYGPGTHTWPYWTRDLAWSIDRIMFDFAHPTPRPPGFTYMSADDRYSVYGWTVSMRRSVREFSTLRVTSPGGFTLSGSGSATVLTPAVYRRRVRYLVTLTGDQMATRSFKLTGGRDRRLKIEVPLGPSNAYQEDTAQAQATGDSVFTTIIKVKRARR